ncbi:hypothetical protein HMPREF1991_03210 [Hoylesella loescheii DSM 19665 = JCM 12249 = ATCC 15930]|uniref:Uncharacterized protein n=1 Tax=Hoylesella loescheii DSM 19665 = JCM 12249 = ATCC 15930 TaxID=1122985 RepID=A0A069QCZ9_HOYLO|nr:hypothetical protein HMPREF1991_03210 [Hoylesella loescheii DSM 19665 = JCM 12249 = ATCC 15930]
MVDTRITGSYVYYVLYDKNAINKYEVHHFGRKMAIGAWLDKGRILSEFDRNEKNIIHLSKNTQNTLPFIGLILHLHL